ncbi:unnamed protein product [Triticum turgidum subsp. durum]|uniref:Uncharacterized protein n=2 Tax=Triticum TaxID=4564 RepID=A0A9R1QA19_TRITD|nr:unnamed protein product [Triticum aestivum]VAH73467.1 unnamed protein product [Triticum turgidum subsp. durum]
MPKRTMGGRADVGADAMAHKASKHRAKPHMEKPLPAGKGSSRQQGGLDVVDHVQASVQVSPTPEQVAPPPEQVTCLPRHLPPLPRHLPPLPQPVVNVNGDDNEEETEQVSPLPRVTPPVPEPVVVGDVNKEDVAALAPQTEQVSPLPRVTPPVPEPVVVGDVNKENVAPLASLSKQVVAPQPQPGIRLPRLLPPLPPPMVVADENEEEVFPGQYKANKVLSDDVDSDQETQRIFRRQKLRQLESGELEKAVRPRFGNGYGCPFYNKVMKGDLSSTINHAVGTSQGSIKNGYAFTVKHAAYADYLIRLL